MSDVLLIDYYVTIFGMMTEDLEGHGNWLNLWRGRTCDDMVRQAGGPKSIYYTK